MPHSTSGGGSGSTPSPRQSPQYTSIVVPWQPSVLHERSLFGNNMYPMGSAPELWGACVTVFAQRGDRTCNFPHVKRPFCQLKYSGGWTRKDSNLHLWDLSQRSDH